MDKKGESIVVRAAYGTVRSLGGVVGVSCGFVRGVGTFIGSGTSKILRLFSRTTKLSTRKRQTISAQEQVRAIVVEELTRLQGSVPGITLGEFEERLRLMAETIEAIQKRILELSDQGFERETLISTAMASVKDVSLLNSEERIILTNIFRQNIALQKPELVGTANLSKGIALQANT